MSIEEPGFKVIAEEGDIEFRSYDSFIVAETLITGDVSRDKASNEGFRRLFGYISGDNTAQQKIAMTAPVLQTSDVNKKGEKIDMTAPVQQAATDEGWLVSFVLPLSYTYDTAPMPSDSRVKLREVKGRTMAVKRFSGRWKDKNILRHQGLLTEALAEMDIITSGKMEFAAYNAPFMPPFMRRNEVMTEVEYSAPE